MQVLSFVLSGVALAAGGIAFLVCGWLNGMLFLVNVFAFKPTPYVYGSYATVFVVCAALEAAFMAKSHWGSVLIPVVPLLWAWHLGMFAPGAR